MSAKTFPVTHAANGLQDFIAISRYARFSPEKRRRETWAESVARVRDMHLAHFPDRSLSDGKLTALAAGDVTPAELAVVDQAGGLHAAIADAFAAVERREILP